MTYETKYQIGQNVFIVGTKIERMIITAVRINHDKHNDPIYIYTLGCDYNKNELDLYTTKEEAAEAWLKKQGLDCGLSNA